MRPVLKSMLDVPDRVPEAMAGKDGDDSASGSVLKVLTGLALQVEVKPVGCSLCRRSDNERVAFLQGFEATGQGGALGGRAG